MSDLFEENPWNKKKTEWMETDEMELSENPVHGQRPDSDFLEDNSADFEFYDKAEFCTRTKEMIMIFKQRDALNRVLNEIENDKKEEERELKRQLWR